MHAPFAPANDRAALTRRTCINVRTAQTRRNARPTFARATLAARRESARRGFYEAHIGHIRHALRGRRTGRRGQSECAMSLSRHGPPLGASLAAFSFRYRAALCLHAPEPAHGVSQLLAGTRNGPGRSPGTARVRGLRTTPAGAAPCPTP